MKPVGWIVDGIFFDSLGAALNMSLNFEQPCIPLYTAPRELSDEEIKKCVIAWVKQIYGNEYVTPLDSHIIKGTKLIRLAEKRIFKNDSL